LDHAVAFDVVDQVAEVALPLSDGLGGKGLFEQFSVHRGSFLI
jgi:hypothetical protein